jgi:hypothetical protein
MSKTPDPDRKRSVFDDIEVYVFILYANRAGILPHQLSSFMLHSVVELKDLSPEAPAMKCIKHNITTNQVIYIAAI